MITWKPEDFLLGKGHWIDIFEAELSKARKSRNNKNWQIAGIAYQIARQKGATNDDMEAKLVSVFEAEFRRCSDQSSLNAYFHELSQKLVLTEETKAEMRSFFG